jgi:hypothetical protein
LVLLEEGMSVNILYFGIKVKVPKIVEFRGKNGVKKERSRLVFFLFKIPILGSSFSYTKYKLTAKVQLILLLFKKSILRHFCKEIKNDGLFFILSTQIRKSGIM